MITEFKVLLCNWAIPDGMTIGLCPRVITLNCSKLPFKFGVFHCLGTSKVVIFLLLPNNNIIFSTYWKGDIIYPPKDYGNDITKIKVFPASALRRRDLFVAAR